MAAARRSSGGRATEYLERSRLRRFMARAGDRLVRGIADARGGRRRLVLGRDGARTSISSSTRPYERGGGPVARRCRGRPGSPAGSTTTSTTPLDKHADRPARRQDGADLGGRRRRDAPADLPRDSASETNQLANALAALGVGKGDRVGIFMPMLPETVDRDARRLGKIGAIYIPIFSGYGAEAVATRLRDAGAKAADHRRRLLPARQGRADEGDRRRGGRRRADGRASRRRAPPRRRRGRAVDGGPRPLVARDRRRPADRVRDRADRRRRPVHDHLHLRHDRAGRRARCTPTAASRSRRRRTWRTASTCRQDDTLFWLTDLGWMMGPWAITGTLMLGATLVIYEGTPDYPGARPPLGAGRAHQRHRLRRRADRRPRADGAGRRVAARARSLLAARARLDRRAVESRPVAAGSSRGRRRALPDHQLLRRHRDLRRHPRLHHDPAAQADLLLRAGAGHGRRRGGRRRATRCAARSASW